MIDSELILSLIEEKRRLFMDYEQATEEMLFCSVDELETFALKRDNLIDQIDMADIKIESAILRDDSSDLLFEALRCECERGPLPDDIGALYDAAAGVRSVILRISEAEEQVSARLVREQERLIELIKSANRGAAAKAARFNMGQDAVSKSYRITDA